MSQSESPWSVPVALTDIPEDGQHFDLSADEEIRAAVAKLAHLRSLPRLQADFDVTRQGAQRLHVRGHVTATVGQTCVVTLDPIENQIDETVDLVFAPPGEVPLPEDFGVSESGVEEAPEPLVGGRVDLGALATEFLLLGIDPYPRKPGAAFEPPRTDDGKASPFAALAALKKGRGVKDD